MEVLLYFDETQNVSVNLLISVCRLTSTAPGFTLRFVFCQSKATDPMSTVKTLEMTNSLKIMPEK